MSQSLIDRVPFSFFTYIVEVCVSFAVVGDKILSTTAATTRDLTT